MGNEPISIDARAMARALYDQHTRSSRNVIVVWDDLGDIAREHWHRLAIDLDERYREYRDAPPPASADSDEITSPETPTVKRTTTDGLPPRAGLEDAPAPAPARADGQHEAYWILSESERAKGFVRPVRMSYVHVGVEGPRALQRPLTDEERERYATCNYVSFEPNPDYPAKSSIIGTYWTQARLDAVGKGCGSVTTMSAAIAETYARDPRFYGSTFCVRCGKHLPVGAAGEFVWADRGGVPTSIRVGT